MTLAGLRKLAVRSRTGIRFTVPGGAECVVDESGVLRVPSLAGPPDFSAEGALAQASEFHLGVSRVTREQLEAVLDASPKPQPAHHEDE